MKTKWALNQWWIQGWCLGCLRTTLSSGRFRVVPRVPWNPLWAAPSTKKYWLIGSLSVYRTKKLLLWLTLACFSRNFVQKQIDWIGRTDSFSQKRSKWVWVLLQSGCGFKIFARNCTIETPLLQILDLPLLNLPLRRTHPSLDTALQTNNMQ